MYTNKDTLRPKQGHCMQQNIIKWKQVVKVIWHKTALPPQMDGSIVFARWRQCAHMGGHIGATRRIRLYSFGPPESTTQTANQSVQPFLHSSRQKIPILYNGRRFPQKLPLLVGDLDLYLIHDFLSQTKPTVQTASRSVQLFSHRWP